MHVVLTVRIVPRCAVFKMHNAGDALHYRAKKDGICVL